MGEQGGTLSLSWLGDGVGAWGYPVLTRGNRWDGAGVGGTGSRGTLSCLWLGRVFCLVHLFLSGPVFSLNVLCIKLPNLFTDVRANN